MRNKDKCATATRQVAKRAEILAGRSDLHGGAVQKWELVAAIDTAELSTKEVYS